MSHESVERSEGQCQIVYSETTQEIYMVILCEMDSSARASGLIPFVIHVHSATNLFIDSVGNLNEDYLCSLSVHYSRVLRLHFAKISL